MRHQAHLLILASLMIGASMMLGACSKLDSTQALSQIEFENLNSEKVTLAPTQQYRLINFWATWCMPCIDELPELSAIYQQLDHNKIQFVGISIDDHVKTRGFFKVNPATTFNILSSDADAMALSEKLGNDKSVVPYTVVIDPQGKVIKQIFGRIHPSDLQQYLVTLTH